MSRSSYAGFLNLNKPLGWTSHDAVARVRRHYRALTASKKVGHAGTLDPLASGVLVLCLGKATRLSDYVMRGSKGYAAQVTLGKTTTTYDGEGDVIRECDPSAVQLSDIQAALPQFIGDVQQLPPMYSAVKVQGRKLYELARQGQTIERRPRRVRIDSIAVRAWDGSVLALDVRCAAGTYIRSLAHDLGQALGVGAYLSALQRVCSGAFKISDSISPAALENSSDWQRHIIAPYDALCSQPRLTLSAAEIQRVRHGQFIEQRHPATTEVFAFDSGRQLVAILQPRAGLWKPHKVFLD